MNWHVYAVGAGVGELEGMFGFELWWKNGNEVGNESQNRVEPNVPNFPRNLFGNAPRRSSIGYVEIII
jgi:hypothetical protein